MHIFQAFASSNKPNVIPVTCWQSLTVNSRQIEGGELTAVAAAPERGQKVCYLLCLARGFFSSRNLTRTIKQTLKLPPLLSSVFSPSMLQ